MFVKSKQQKIMEQFEIKEKDIPQKGGKQADRSKELPHPNYNAAQQNISIAVITISLYFSFNAVLFLLYVLLLLTAD